jgi:ribosomal protein S18 acetylase RimI-like enzyme
MTAKVIQGLFPGGQPKLPPPAIQARTAARLPSPPRTAFAARPPGPPAPAFAGRHGAVQRHGSGGAFAVEAGQLGLTTGGGRPLPEAVRGNMEAVLGADFSNVRVHVGPQAERIGAIAFTLGSDIYFAPGRYQPDTVQGQQLLGHELAHVVQQRAGRVRNPLGSGLAVVQDHALEAEAERLGQRAAAHRVETQAKMMPGVAQPSSPVRISPPISTGPGRFRLTAGAGGRPVGSVMVHQRDKGTVEVTDLSVDEAQRGHGIGQMLVASAAKTGLQFGKSKVTLAAQDGGSGHLTQWYKGMGFTQIGVNSRGFPQLEAPINRLVGASAQRKPFPRGSSTLQAMDSGLVGLEAEATKVEGRRKFWRKKFGQDVAVMKLELAGSGHQRWYFRGGKEQGLKPLTGKQTEFKRDPEQIVEKRTKVNDETYSIAGPLAVGGASNSGPNSIENNVNLAIGLIDDFVDRHSKKFPLPPLILILIKAHSRNSVAGIQIANFVQSTYGDTHIPRVHVDLAAFDPVPGPLQKVEYRKTAIDEQMSQSTVVYSAATQYPTGFDPQRVYFAKRVIVSSKNHGVGYTDGVIFQGSLYKGSRISALPEGFYIGSPAAEGMAEQISQCHSVYEVKQFLATKKSTSQKQRQKIIVKVAKVFFGETKGVEYF